MTAAGARARARTGGHGRSRKGVHEEEHVNHERWLLSYVDMVTVLMALFIVLFAISQVDQDKYIQLRESLAAGFNDNSPRSVLDGSSGTLEGASFVPENSVAAGTAGLVDADSGLGSEGAAPVPAATATVDPTVLAAAEAEAEHLQALQAELEKLLDGHGLADSVRFRINERGLVMGLVADDVFFGPASAQLTATAEQVLDVSGPTLVAIAESISVEGHANTVPVSGRYATNWELSADRATQVLRHLVETMGLPATRVMSVGYGDSRPLVEGGSPEALMANRRVDLVILSSAPEQVRTLVPTLIETKG